jgi:hypothetical protein
MALFSRLGCRPASSREQSEYLKMVTILFPDRPTEKRALAFLLGRFSGRVLQSGEHLVPEAALEALADQNIPFTVKGKATYEQHDPRGHGSPVPGFDRGRQP